MRRWLSLAALSLLAAAPLRDTGPRFEASGTEPRWSLTIVRGQILFEEGKGSRRPRTDSNGDADTIERSPGRMRISATMEEPQLVQWGTGRNGRPVYYVESAEWQLSIQVTAAPCTDAKHRQFPSQVVLRYGEQDHHGCGGSLAELEAGLIAP